MLTKCQNEILAYTAAGLSAKEIADHSGRSIWTVQKTICNVKEKTGLQKATELVAYYFCRKLDTDFADFKRQILSTAIMLLLFFHRVLGLKSRKRVEEFKQLIHYII